METDKRTGKADVIYMIATRYFPKIIIYISEDIGFIFCI